MKAIAKVQTTNREINQLQSNIITQLNQQRPTNLLAAGVILEKISLIAGNNTINHKLDRNLQGWFIIRQRSSASIYDKQDSNQIPDKTLILNSSADVTVDIFVF